MHQQQQQQQQLPSEVAGKRSFYLPRASIGSASHSGSSSKSSNRSREFTPNPIDEEIGRGESELEEGAYHHNDPYHDGDDEDGGKKQPMYIVPRLSSSSSSSGSNQSNYSVNSLLLSVKNLENFNRANNIDRKHQKRHHHHHHHHQRSDAMASEHNPNITLKSNYYLNYFINQETASHFPLYEHRWKMLQNIKNIATHDDKTMPSISKTTEADQLSTTSSTTTTNFTVISLNDSSQRLNKSKKAICRRSHTISILIFVMTGIFVILISVLLLLMDMRNQNMPR